MSESGKISSAEAIVFGKFTLFPAARSLECEGAPLAVGSRAIEILLLLLERAGTVVTKKELIARAWPHVTVEESGLKVQVASLRKILKDGLNGNRYIATVNGRGYCFVAPAEWRRRTRHAGLDRSMPIAKYRLVAFEESAVTRMTISAAANAGEVIAAFESTLTPVAQNDNNGASPPPAYAQA